MRAIRSLTRSTVAGAALLASVAAGPAAADEIADEIRNALTLYEAGKVGEAKEALDFATQLLGQRKADDLGRHLPAPLSGWTAEDAEATSAAMYGAGITAGRTYRKGDAEVEVRIIGDSPMIQAMSMMFSNPAMAGAAGGRAQRIGKQRGIVTQDGDVQVMAGKYLVMVSGSAPQDAKVAYAAAVDFDGLSKP